MFTVLWKISDDREELYCAANVSLIPETKDKDHDWPTARHVAFPAKVGYGDGTQGWSRTVISTGSVYVMNETGATVAIYHFR